MSEPARGQFTWQDFIRDTRSILFTGSVGYFKSLDTGLPLSVAFIRAVLYGVVTGVLAWFWGIAGLGEEVFGRNLSAIEAFSYFIIQFALTLVGLWAGALLVMAASAVAGGTRSFASAAHITGALLAFAPLVMAVRGVAALHGDLSAILVLLLVLYAASKLYLALVHTQGASPAGAVISVLGLLVLIIGALAALALLAPAG